MTSQFDHRSDPGPTIKPKTTLYSGCLTVPVFKTMHWSDR